MLKFFLNTFIHRDLRFAWLMLVVWTVDFAMNVMQGGWAGIPLDLFFAGLNLYSIYGREK